MSDYTDNKAQWVTIKTETTAGANTADRVGTAGENAALLIGAATGWGNYQDTQYTVGAPFSVIADTDTALPNNKGSIIETQLPVDVTTFYDGTVITGEDGDGMSILVEAKAKPTNVSATYIESWIEIGASIELFKRITGFPKGNGVERPISFTTAAFNGATWASGGAKLYIRSNGPLDIYDIRYLIARTHKAI
jgi:hypothetical protein